MNVHIIDDEEYFHDDARIKLKRIGFSENIYCYFGSEEFLKRTKDMDLSNDLVVVDYELGIENACDDRISEKIREQHACGALVLFSLLPCFGRHDQEIRSQYDEIVRKSKIDWDHLISLPVLKTQESF